MLSFHITAIPAALMTWPCGPLMVEVGDRVPEPCRSLTWLLCLSSLPAPGSVCCHCSCLRPLEASLPSWKLQDSVLFGGGQVLVLSQGREGLSNAGRFCPTLTGFFIYVCVNLLGIMCCYFSLKTGKEVGRLLDMKYCGFQANSYIEK